VSPSSDTYGEAFAEVYDRWYPADGEVPAAVRRLRELSDGGPVLELGVGTGRIALPLAATGVPVWGVDASEGMLARLAAKDPAVKDPAAKDPACGVTAVLGDMATLALPPGAPAFGLAFAAFNTFYLLASEDAQRSCLRRCHELLVPGGRLALELYSPAPAAPGHDRWADVVVAADGTRHNRSYHRSPHDPRLLVGRTGARPWALRPLPVPELDELAASSGFRLEARWQDWTGRPYFAHRARHVSVWRAALSPRPRGGTAGPPPRPAWTG
jgi:SAM-dependent methyltransferase